jgi:hypothetical protein
MGFRLRAVSLHADSDRTISRVAEHLVLAWTHDTGADLAKTNVNGGQLPSDTHWARAVPAS